MTPSPVVPYAALQYVNAVPDTGEMDMRVIDIVSNSGLFDATFREMSAFPQPIEAGERRIRVFMSSRTNQAIASTVVWDTTFSFTEDGYYKFVLAGFSRSGQTPAIRAHILPDAAPPAVGPGQWAVRVLNLAPSMAGAVPTVTDTTALPDAFFLRVADVPGGAPQATGVAYLGSSGYAVLDTGRYRVALTATGTTTPAVVQAHVPTGSGVSGTGSAIAGSRIGGSVLTAVIVPRSVPGSAAPEDGPPDPRDLESVTRSGDTVTAQSGSSSVLVNRPDTVVMDTIIAGGDTSIVADTVSQADSVVAESGTGASTAAATGDIVLVSGAADPAYNGWHGVTVADSLVCSPVHPDDEEDACAAENAIATTFFRFRYRIAGAPASPATGTVVYRIYTPTTDPDYTTPSVIFFVDRRP